MRLVVPFAPGGPADLIARIVGQKLSEEFGKQFYVETHAGAGGNTGTGLAARAPADGYTLLVNSQALVINASLYKTLPYDPDKDLAADHAHGEHAERRGRAPVGAGEDR